MNFSEVLHACTYEEYAKVNDLTKQCTQLLKQVQDFKNVTCILCYVFSQCACACCYTCLKHPSLHLHTETIWQFMIENIAEFEHFDEADHVIQDVSKPKLYLLDNLPRNVKEDYLCLYHFARSICKQAIDILKQMEGSKAQRLIQNLEYMLY